MQDIEDVEENGESVQTGSLFCAARSLFGTVPGTAFFACENAVFMVQ